MPDPIRHRINSIESIATIPRYARNDFYKNSMTATQPSQLIHQQSQRRQRQ